MRLKSLDKIEEAEEIVDGIRDTIIYLEDSCTGPISGGVGVVLNVALNKVLALLREAAVQAEVNIDPDGA